MIIPHCYFPVKAEHRKLADRLGVHRRTVDGVYYYDMTERNAKRFNLLKDSGLVMCAEKKRDGIFKVPGHPCAALTLSQALAVVQWAKPGKTNKVLRVEAFDPHRESALVIQL